MGRRGRIRKSSEPQVRTMHALHAAEVQSQSKEEGRTGQPTTHANRFSGSAANPSPGSAIYRVGNGTGAGGEKARNVASRVGPLDARDSRRLHAPRAKRLKCRGSLPGPEGLVWCETVWWSQAESNRRPLECHSCLGSVSTYHPVSFPCGIWVFIASCFILLPRIGSLVLPGCFPEAARLSRVGSWERPD